MKGKTLPPVENIFTFGDGQEHAGHYVAIVGTDEFDCRRKMREIFGERWAFQYPDRRKAGVYSFDLKELDVNDIKGLFNEK